MDGGHQQSTQIVPRATVDQICAHRDRALELWRQAHESLTLANSVIQDAKRAGHAAAPTRNSFNRYSDESKAVFYNGLDFPNPDTFMENARRIVDADVWAHLIEITDLEALMDKTAKDDLRRQMMSDPPEATPDNIFATLESFRQDADMIFKRGVAEAFSNLDRRFRSHDGWKFGSRVIISNAFDDWGHWNFHSNHRDTLTDIERVFHVLEDGRNPPAYGGIVHLIDEARRGGGLRARQTEVDSEFFLVRIFKNGNAHLWFKRKDLLEKVNQILGEYYNAPIPEDREPEDDGGLFRFKTTPAKNHGYYPTPDRAAELVIDNTPLWQPEGAPALTVLEPSAGHGSLAKRVAETGAIVDCVEIQPKLAHVLESHGTYRRVMCVNFLGLTPDPDNLYDRVVMNPPFDRERDIDHVMHALTFLKDDGVLVAVMSAGTEFRDTRKSNAFRDFMDRMNASWRDLPPRSFSEVGTNCNTLILKVRKDARRSYS